MNRIFSGFPTEKIILYKKSGEVIKNIEALVQPKLILIEAVNVVIEEEDIFERSLPNGSAERYKVLDRGFYKGMHGIPDHYQVSVIKTTAVPRYTSSGTTYNIQNDAGRININSIDNSVNIALSANEEQLFKTIQQLADSLPNNDEIIKAVFEMKQEARKPSFAAKYNAFIQSIANHITIFAPFIPALTALLIT